MTAYRVSDDVLADIRRALTAQPDVGGAIEPQEAASIVDELIASRAAARAHAEAHPERLTSERINYIIAANETTYVEPACLAMALEIQQRRAADLGPEEVPCIRRARTIVGVMRDGACNVDLPEYERILDTILRAHGATP